MGRASGNVDDTVALQLQFESAEPCVDHSSTQIQNLVLDHAGGSILKNK